jgi:hypothetical protein
MSLKTIVSCNYCPKVRDPEKNHWSMIDMDGGNFCVRPWSEIDVAHVTAHACSDECIKIALGEFLSRQRDVRAATDANAQLEKELLAEKGPKPLQGKAAK